MRQIYGLKRTDKIENLDVNAIKWRMLCPLLFKLQFILGKLRSEFTFHQKAGQANTEKLIRDQKEVTGIPVINWQQLMWQRTTLLTDKAVLFAICKNLRLVRFSAVYGRSQFGSRQSMASIQRIGWPGRWSPQGRSRTGGGGPARVPNLRVCKRHAITMGVAHAGREGRFNVLPWDPQAGVV